jgi:acetolactate synthase-1/3 small subunit
MRHIISLLMENEPGSLSRVVGLFSARGYNIECLTVAPTEDPTLSRLTLVTLGTDAVIEQIVKQLNKLIDVVKIIDLTEGAHLERELMLIKIDANSAAVKEEIFRLNEIFRGNIVDVTDGIYTVQLVGEGTKLDAFIGSMDKALIIETVRSGALGIMRGSKNLHV